jgi:hypothetical protein
MGGYVSRRSSSRTIDPLLLTGPAVDALEEGMGEEHLVEGLDDPLSLEALELALSLKEGE